MAVAILVLIIAGVSYLISSGDKFKLQKSSFLIKSGIGGFALILIGWLIIQSVIRVVGFPNAGSWWSFECNDGSQGVALNNTLGEGNFSPYYNNLKTFPDLASYFASNEKTAKITGPINANSFISQLKALKNGEILHFLAPVQLESSGETENLFLPLLTVLKEGDNLNLQSTGEYLNLLQNEWPQLKDQISDPAVRDLLSQYLGNNSYTDNRSLVDSGGNVISAAGNSDLSSLYTNLAQILKDNSAGGDRTNTNLTDEIAGNASLSELLAILASPDSNSPEQKEKIMSLFTTETLKLSDILMVDKESPGNILVNSQVRCEGSGGTWNNDGDNFCECPTDYQLQGDGSCQSVKELEQTCEKTQGTWQKVSDGYEPPALCGDSTGLLANLINNINSENDRANISDVVPDRYYCKCKNGSCIDSKGNCRSDLKDDDGDKIANNVDHCPATLAAEKNQVNRTKGSQYYGCSCFEIGAASKACPPDQCVGDNWVNYPDTEKQECENGELLPFSCQPTERTFDETCRQKNLANGNGTQEWNGNTNSWDSKTNNWNGNTNSWSQSPYNTNTNNRSTTSPTGANKPNTSGTKAPSNGGKQKNINDKGLGDPKRPGRDRVSSTNDHGNPMGVKASLKRIYEKDKLRYLMVFKYVSQIAPSGGGGITPSWIPGYIGVNYSQPLKYLDQIIIHEATHRADFAWDGWSGSTADLESIAVANQIGSTGRIKESPGQKEEVKVTANPQNDSTKDNPDKDKGTGDRLECRGYNARWLDRDIDPRGDMNPSDIGFAVSYAHENGGGTPSSNIVYGWPPGGDKYILRVSDFQDNRVKIIMEKMNNRNCMSKPPEDLPQLTEENGYKEEQLKGCKDAKPINIGG